MKQKYSVVKDEAGKKLIIREIGELEKDEFSLICEVAFEYKIIKAAIKEGKQALVAALRTPDLYPPAVYMDKIADEITNSSTNMNNFTLISPVLEHYLVVSIFKYSDSIYKEKGKIRLLPCNKHL